jgi:hypothetical protein
MTSENNNQTHGGTLPSSLFFKVRVQLAKIMLPSGMAPDDFVTHLGINLDKTIDDKITLLASEKIASQAREFANSVLANNLKDVSADTLESLITANSKLSDLQKSQIAAILTAPANRTDYLG